jgi:predicted alpha/beta superfamily hydrolase
MKHRYLILLLLAPFMLKAQQPGSKPFILGEIREINSTQLAEKRLLNIYLPDGYKQNDATRYPVIYLLDGSANEDFIHICGLVQFLNQAEMTPKVIVVGIANIDRKRDFTFPTTNAKDKSDYPTTGSSAKFISFIEKELQPFINKTYKTNSSRTIIGQSLGGLLATEILLTKPYLFNKYIIVSPSLWWDDESMLKKAPELLAKQADTPTSVYVSVGTEGKQMEEDANALAKTLQANGKKYWHVIFMPLPDENHLTILHNTAYKGLKLLFSK